MRDRDGQLRRFPLGDWTDKQGIKWARSAAERLRQQVRHDGADPRRERAERKEAARIKAASDSLTFGLLVQEWQTKRLAKRTAKYRAEAVRALKRAYAGVWDKPVSVFTRITARAGLDALQRAPAKGELGILIDGTAIAEMTLRYGRACFNWAMKNDKADGNPFLNLDVETNDASRDRVLSDAELIEVWSATEDVGEVYRRLVRFMLLTGQRKSEVSLMRWGELSGELDVWTLPRPRTKNKKVHVLPIEGQARKIIQDIRAASEEVEPASLVFSISGSAFGAWSKAKKALDATVVTGRKARGVTPSDMPEWRIHDLRRTFATGLQRLHVPLEVTEAALNHVSGTRKGIVSVYQTHTWDDEKRDALLKWDAHVSALIAER